MRKLILALFLLSIPSAASAGEPWWYRLSQVAAGTAHALDLGSTTDCIARGICKEMNPIYGRANNPLTFSLLKGGTTAATIVAVDKVPNRKHGAIVNFIMAGAFSAVAITNYNKARGK